MLVKAWINVLNSTESTSSGFPPLHVTVLMVDRETSWTFLPSSIKRPHLSPSPSSTSSTHSRSSTRNQSTVFTDASSIVYTLDSHCSSTLNSACLPVASPLSVNCEASTSYSRNVPGFSDLPFIPDHEDERMLTSDSAAAATASPGSGAGFDETDPPPIALGRARGTSALIFVPASNDHLSIGMLRLARLHIARVPAKFGMYAAKVGDNREQIAQEAEKFEEQTLKDISRNFYELAVLAKVRWRLGGRLPGPCLPFHLAALDTMRTVLSGQTD